MAGFRQRDLDKYEKFLNSSPADRAKFLESVHPYEVKFYEQLLMTRIDYEIADEKSGSIADERVVRNPERYGKKC